MAVSVVAIAILNFAKPQTVLFLQQITSWFIIELLLSNSYVFP